MERHTLRLKIAGEEYPVITEEDAKYITACGFCRRGILLLSEPDGWEASAERVFFRISFAGGL